MPSPKDKIEKDAERASTRGFGGYIADRLSGSADFSKESSRSETPAATIGSSNPQNDEARKAAGMANGGSVGGFAGNNSLISKSRKPQYR